MTYIVYMRITFKCYVYIHISYHTIHIMSRPYPHLGEDRGRDTGLGLPDFLTLVNPFQNLNRIIILT